MAKCAGCPKDVPEHKKWCSDACRCRDARSRKKEGLPSPGGNIGELARLFAREGIDPSQAVVEKVKLSEWEGMIKNPEGEAELVTQKAASIIISPKWEQGPEWPIVQPAAPVLIKHIHKPRAKSTRDTYQSYICLPDNQIGFRRLADGTLDPFHSEEAMATALLVLEELQPNKIVNMGDVLDFAEMGKFAQEAGFAQTTQASLETAHRYLAKQRAICPKAEIVYLEGNHDQRLQRNISQNDLAAFGLRQAGGRPDSWPVRSVPHLLRLNDLNIQYIGGYPAGSYWINDRLKCSHAPSKYRSSGSSAAASIEDERVSVIVAHTHRISLQHKTRNVRDGFRQNFVAEIGCLARLDGAVPSTKSAATLDGRHVAKYEDWQNAVAVGVYVPGDGDFSLEILPIIEGVVFFRGQRIQA